MRDEEEIAYHCKGFRHAGIVVADIERSVSFYTELFGFSEWKRQREQGRYIETVVGIPGAVIEWAKLKGSDGILLELIQYEAPEPADRRLIDTHRIGCVHLAMTVSDAVLVCQKLRQRGCTCYSEPQRSPDGKVLVFYGRDPDGVILEIVEDLSL